MKTTANIDWREFHNFPHLIKRLNEVLRPHGVIVSDTNSPDCDHMQFTAESAGPNETLQLRAELEACETILSLYRDEARHIERKINNDTFTTSCLRSAARLRGLNLLTPESVGEEFNAMRSALMQAKNALGGSSVQACKDAIGRIVAIVGE